MKYARIIPGRRTWTMKNEEFALFLSAPKGREDRSDLAARMPGPGHALQKTSSQGKR